MRPGGIFLVFLFRSFFGSKVVQDLKMRSFSFHFILSAAAASATRIDVLHLAERFAVVAKPAGTVVQ